MYMFNKVDVVDGCLMLTGLTVSLQDIQATLSIIIIVIDTLWLLLKFLIKFFRYIKDGRLTDEEIDDLLKTKEEIDHVRDEVEKINKEGDK